MKTQSIISGLMFILCSLLPCLGFPYGIETHADMSEQALAASVLVKNPDVLKNIGLQTGQSFPDSNNNFSDINGLFRTGAKFEDNFSRSANHFFDPFNGQGLSVKGIVIGKPSPDWALEDKGEIIGGPVLRGQEFSYRDARFFFYLALKRPTKDERERNFGMTFQTLGQVIHHVQDMAQPQHVRNDQHLEVSSNAELLTCIAYPHLCLAYFSIKNHSFYEAYTNDNRGRLSYSGPVVYPGSEPQTFKTARDFWKNSAGSGLAEFTNRNFVSQGTNFRMLQGQASTTGYAFPRPGAPANYTIDELYAAQNTAVPAGIQSLCSNVGVNCKMTMYPTPLTPKASTLSIFDQDMQAKGLRVVYNDSDGTSIYYADRLFALNRFNFDAAHETLIPKAVGYSAGLINYFFRGKIDLVPDPVNTGKHIIKNLGPEDMKGTFTLYYDAVDGNRYPVAGDSPDKTWESLAIPKNSQVDKLSFTPPTTPAPQTSGEYMLVFNGDMGGEKAIPGITVGAVTAKKIAVHVNGELYIVGNDAGGSLLSLKVDKTGIHLVSGYDANGVYRAATEFDPLPEVVTASYGRGTGLLSKAHTLKQAVFTGGGSNAPHQTVAVAFSPPFSYPVSYILDSKTGKFLRRSALTWLAKSPDQAIGEFEFSYTGALNFTRKFKNAEGVERTVTGTIPIPNPWQNIAGTGVVSGNGLRVGEAHERVGVLPNVTEKSYDLVITLSEIPTAGLELVYQHTDTFSSNYAMPTCVVTEKTALIEYTDCAGNGIYSNGLSPEVGNHQSKGEGRKMIGYFNDKKAVLKWTSDVNGYTNWGSLLQRFRVTNCEHSEWHMARRQEGKYVAHFSDANIEALSDYAPKEANKTVVSDFGSNGCSVTYQVTYADASRTQDTIWSGRDVLDALTGKSTDAVYYKPNESSGDYYFREIPFQYGDSVADASPLGEVFFAKRDMSVVIHEPKSGGISKIGRTDLQGRGMVKILAVLWL